MSEIRRYLFSKSSLVSWLVGVCLFVVASTTYGQQLIIEQSIQPTPLKAGDRYDYRLNITNLSGDKHYIFVSFPPAIWEISKSPIDCNISSYTASGFRTTYECIIQEETDTTEFHFTGNIYDDYDGRISVIKVEENIKGEFKDHLLSLNIKGKHESIFEKTLKLAKQGDKEAQFDLGGIYEDGEFVERDLSKATYWLEKAAQQEHAVAQMMLGFSYGVGEGVPQDKEKAKYWLRKSIENSQLSGDTYTMDNAFEAWGMLNLGEYSPRQFAGSYKDGTYAAPNKLFSAKYQLSGVSESDPCCQQTVGDMFDEQTGMGVVSLSNEYGAVNGVFYGPASAIKYESGDNNLERLKKWFYAVVMERLQSNVPESTVLKEESRKFNRMDAWIAVVEIPGGGVITSYESETGHAGQQNSVRGFVVFQRGDKIFALMNENNVLGFTGPPRVYDPDNWDNFLTELSAFYSTMKFK